MDAQQNLAQQAYDIFVQHCYGCHGPSGSQAAILTIQHAELIKKQLIIPRDPDNSELYKRLLGNTEKGLQMPLGQEPLDDDTRNTIRRWIEEGALNWNEVSIIKPRFITTEAVLRTIYTHKNLLKSLTVPLHAILR